MPKLSTRDRDLIVTMDLTHCTILFNVPLQKAIVIGHLTFEPFLVTFNELEAALRKSIENRKKLAEKYGK